MPVCFYSRADEENGLFVVRETMLEALALSRQHRVWFLFDRQWNTMFLQQFDDAISSNFREILNIVWPTAELSL